MNKILLALTFLAAGAGTFHSARQHASQLQQKVSAASESWQLHPQHLASAQSEQASLTEHIRELKQALAQSQPAAGSALWSALQTNRADRLPAELRQRTLAELGFDWRTSPDYIVVSKQAVRDLQMTAVRKGQLTDAADAALALTPEERGQVEAALERVKTDFRDWVLAHVERSDTTDEVLARYTLPKDPAVSQSISNAFTVAVYGALGRERAELVLPTAQDWMKDLGLYDCDAKPQAFTVKRDLSGKEPRLKVKAQNPFASGNTFSRDLWMPKLGLALFPRVFRTVFPNGWADVAKREGFELPEESQEK